MAKKLISNTSETSGFLKSKVSVNKLKTNYKGQRMSDCAILGAPASKSTSVLSLLVPIVISSYDKMSNSISSTFLAISSNTTYTILKN